MSQISSLRIVYNAATRDLLSNDLPALQVLIVDGICLMEKSVMAQSISNHSFTLRSLKASGLITKFYPEDFDPFKNSRWPHLTHVDITVGEQSKLFRLLQRAPNLSSAKIIIASERAMYPLPVEPCTHTKLQALYIESYKSLSSLPNLLGALSLPNLHEFTASFVWTRWPHEEFKAFLLRSKCPLEFLKFGDLSTTRSQLDEQRVEYTALIPSLEAVVDPVYARVVTCDWSI
ncbi:hypothetical protein BDR04DRAFT_1230561 [Suillus decipiens]|nr:hypothetical protein BDR04DRAFT_1230561 [Suillus decipiens]